MALGRATNPEPEPLAREASRQVWVECRYPLVALGLNKILRAAGYDVRHDGRQQHESATAAQHQQAPASVIYYPDSNEGDVAQEVKRLKEIAPDAPVLVFGLAGDLPLARAALRAGAGGFMHIRMQPSQIVRALSLASKGEIVVPRELVMELIKEESRPDLLILTARQKEILALVAEGLTNAQVAEQLFLSESTIKQHLRAAYKLLGVRNRTEATRLIRQSV